MRRILCIEAGTEVASVALGENGRLVSLRESGQGREHARNLALYVDEILHEHNLHVDDLSAVAVGRGPGSYTGLRIATALAKGLCYGARLPLISVGSLEALCRVALEEHQAGVLNLEVNEQSVWMPMIDARRMEVYCQPFDAQAQPLAEVEAHILTPDSFLQWRVTGRSLILFGDGAEKCRGLFPEANVHIAGVLSSARGLVAPAFEAFRARHFESIAYFEPFYLKDFLVTTSVKKKF